MREVNIGTADIERAGSNGYSSSNGRANGEGSAHHHGDPLQQQQQQPALSEVETHLQRVRLELCGERYPPSGYALRAVVPATPAGLARAAALEDLMDQVRYWAVEEATTFCHEPSRLAETEAPEAVVACLATGRASLIAQTLRVVQPMLGHRQTAAELRRVLGEVQGRRDAAAAAAPLPDGCDSLFAFLADVLTQYTGVVPLLIEVLSTATAALVHAGAARASDDVLAADAESEADAHAEAQRQRVAPLVVALHETTLVHQLECTMRRHASVAQVQVEGVAFFAALVDLPWPFPDDADEADADGASPPSLADIVACSDGILAVLQAALDHHRQHLCVTRGVLHVWRVCAEHPRNRVSLLRHGAYAGALQALREVGPYTLDISRAVAETVAYFVPLLDTLQRRTLALSLRNLLQHRPQLEMLELLLALLLSLLMVLSKSRAPAGGSGVGAFDRYAMYPQPRPSNAAAALPPGASTADGQRPSSRATLRCGPVQWHPPRDDADTWRFLLEQCAVPQQVSGLLAYLDNCEVVDDEDAAEVDRVCELAAAVLQFF